MICCCPSYHLIIITVIFTFSGRGACLCHQDQSAALLGLKGSFRFDRAASNLSSWKANTDCCNWEGIRCDGDSGHVTALDLSNIDISGNLSSDIFKLTSLRFLSLANNHFDGSPLPNPGIEQLPDLKYLDLAFSGLCGDLLVGNGQLDSLVILNLSGLDLKNLSFVTLIDSLSSLQKLYLDSVNISIGPSPSGQASSPDSTNTASGLQELSMQFGTITGRLDTALRKLRFLSSLTLDGSKFKDPIPVLQSLAESSSLVILNLLDCGLIGTFPSGIFHIKSLIVLDLSANENLYGELPEFMQGSALQRLTLRGTKFSGKIPESIGNLRNLSALDFDSCQFHGPIPSFTHWPNISSVVLSGNNLTGSLPSDGYLARNKLTYINLSNNSISGEIPATLFSHPSLQGVYLSQNNFTGNFLLYPNVSSNLRWIDVSKNKLQGHVPKYLSKLFGLEMLDLSSNNLTGTMGLSLVNNWVNITSLSLSNNRLSIVVEDDSHSFTNCPKLAGLLLASCNLTKVPKFLINKKDIVDLDLSNNNIAGHIPDWIWGIEADILSVNLSHNLFTSVRANISNMSTFGLVLDIHSNKIQGSLPVPPRGILQLDCSNNHFNSDVMSKFWSHVVSSCIILSLSNNSLTGEVSHLICNATDMIVLDLSFNHFSGLIPPCLLKHKKMSLVALSLRGNNFHGSLPQKISKGCLLETIDLNGNKLEGKLPGSLVNCRMLRVLDIGNNQIVDIFPEWLEGLPLLKVLILRSNRFHGHIDHYDGKRKQMHPVFPALQVLDLSSNAFNGSISTRFLKTFKAMIMVSSEPPSIHVDASNGWALQYYKNSVTFILKGIELTLVKILLVFTTLDLSNNNFEGIISGDIGDLKLLQGLNLSRNRFTGGIPPRIASMMQLESLDLSYNQLSGEIPPDMGLLTFLEVLNLSYNHLSGPIPQSNQFSTFPDTSFLGNDKLCGTPLPHQCNASLHSFPAAPPKDSADVSWDVVSVEVGVVLGLAAVVGTTLLWGSGRRWVYGHVDKFLLRLLRHRRH